MLEKDSPRTSNAVLVLGGGIAGIKASLDLAEAGRQVYIVEEKPALGGFLPLLDRQFPTNDCNICYLMPEGGSSGSLQRLHPLPMSRLSELKGSVGEFSATIETKPRFIDTDRCNACGACLAACPEGAVVFTPGLDTNSPTCLRYPQATPQAFSIDMDKCTKCGECLKVCHPDAIDLEMRGGSQELEVGSVILASGAQVWDPTPMEEWYGYHHFPDVITSLEFEQLMSAAGPTGGAFQRPSDGRRPTRIGWIQCAGSRTTKPGGNAYCSSICCMISMKEAIWALEHFDREIEATVFFMDMRPMGKDYELYYQRAKNELGVKFARCMPHTVERNEHTGDLVLSHLDDAGNLQEAHLDLIVLATGFCAPNDAAEQAAVLGIELTPEKFVAAEDFAPVSTSRPGVYACGMALGPQDIPSSLVSGLGRHLPGQRRAGPAPGPGPLGGPAPGKEDLRPGAPHRRVSSPTGATGGQGGGGRGSGAGGGLPVGGRGLCAPSWSWPTAPEGLDKLRQAIAEHNLNRVVVAGYSPRTHGTLFAEAMRRAGLNRAMLEMANIRDQDALVHRHDPHFGHRQGRGPGAHGGGRGAPGQAHAPSLTLPFNPNALVVGGGVAGMSAALRPGRPRRQGAPGGARPPLGRTGQRALPHPGRPPGGRRAGGDDRPGRGR